MTSDRDDRDDDVVPTPAACMETKVPLEHIRLETEHMDGNVTVSMKSDLLNGLVFFNPEEAREIAEDLTRLASEAEAWREREDIEIDGS